MRSGAAKFEHGIAVFVLLCCWFVPPRLLVFTSLHVNDIDFGIYLNLVWNIAHGHGFHSSILHRSHLGEHFSPIMALFAPVSWLGIAPWALLFAQGAAAAMTAFVLLAIAGREMRSVRVAHLRRGILVFLSIVFLFYRPFIEAWDFQFQPILLGAPIIALALRDITEGSARRIWLLAILLMLTRESAGLSVAGLGILLFARRDQRRNAVMLVAAGLISSAIVTAVLIPCFRHGPWEEHMARLAPAHDPWGKVLYAIKLLGPLGFTPVAAWPQLLAAVPGVLLNAASNLKFQYNCEAHYDAQSSVFLMYAAIIGAKKLASSLDFPHKPAGLAAIVKCAALALALLSVTLYTQIQWQSSHPVRRYARNWPTLESRRIIADLKPIAAIDSTYLLSADPVLGPHLCERHRYRTLYDADWPSRLEPSQIVVIRKKTRDCQDLITTGRLLALCETPQLRLLVVPPTTKEMLAELRRLTSASNWRWHEYGQLLPAPHTNVSGVSPVRNPDSSCLERRNHDLPSQAK